MTIKIRHLHLSGHILQKFWIVCVKPGLQHQLLRQLISVLRACACTHKATIKTPATQRQKISAPACACHRDNQQRGPIGCATQYHVATAEIVYFFPLASALWLRNVEGTKVESQQGCVGSRTSPAPFRATMSAERGGSDKIEDVLFHGSRSGCAWWCRDFQQMIGFCQGS